MIQWLFEIIGPIAKWQTDVLVAIIGLASAVVVASVGLFGSSLTILINKRNERKIDLRKIKEKQYIDFLSCLALAKISNENEIHENNLLLSSRIQTIYLVGNREVQMALSEFLKMFTNGEHTAEKIWQKFPAKRNTTRFDRSLKKWTVFLFVKVHFR